LALTYALSGVDTDAGERLVRRIRRSAASTFSHAVLNDIGAFGAFFDARFRGYKSPVLVSSVDGVGTKLKIAHLAGRHDTIGQDLVNHCVNDIAVSGATPLFFLDYFATGKLNVGVAAAVIRGFAKACRQNGCSLVGGETAEMPGFYSDGEYDIAGMIVGVVDRRKIVDGKRIRPGDLLIGVSSNGLHTNGFSLVRRVLLKKFALDEQIPELGTTLVGSLLAVHRSYRKSIASLLRGTRVHGFSHVTGGGIIGNTMRVLPAGLHLKINWDAWKRPPIFDVIQKAGDIPEDDMRRTFNLGVGLVAIIPPSSRSRVLTILKALRERAFVMGEVEQ
jgi:phosphoribosylformylglycinamidine cyclo-ligase